MSSFAAWAWAIVWNGLLTVPLPPAAAELSTCANVYGVPVCGSIATTSESSRERVGASTV